MNWTTNTSSGVTWGWHTSCWKQSHFLVYLRCSVQYIPSGLSFITSDIINVWDSPILLHGHAARTALHINTRIIIICMKRQDSQDDTKTKLLLTKLGKTTAVRRNFYRSRDMKGRRANVNTWAGSLDRIGPGRGAADQGPAVAPVGPLSRSFQLNLSKRADGAAAEVSEHLAHQHHGLLKSSAEIWTRLSSFMRRNRLSKLSPLQNNLLFGFLCYVSSYFLRADVVFKEMFSPRQREPTPAQIHRDSEAAPGIKTRWPETIYRLCCRGTILFLYHCAEGNVT